MAANKYKGITVVIDGDTTGLSNAFKKVNADIKDTSYEIQDIERSIKNVPGLIKDWGLTTDLLKDKQNLLTDQIKETNERIHIESEALKSLAEQDQTPEVVKAQEQLQRELDNDKAKLRNLEEEFENFGSVGKQHALMVAESIQNIGGKITEVGDQMQSVGRNLTQKVTTPIVTAGTSMFNSAVDFESAMAKVRSVSLDATAEDMQDLTELALKLSGDSKYSATEAAEALYYMGLAGWETEEMLEALPDVLNLAAAGDLDLGRASDIVTDYVTAFGLSAEEATHLVDVMAQTMTNSNTTVDQMGTAFKYIAPVAGAAGYSIDDISLALGIMANNGIKGSQAGTTLRMLLQRLVKPTDEVADAMDKLNISLTDDEGNLISFEEVMDQLRVSMNGIDFEKLSNGLSKLDSQLEDGIITEEEYDSAVNNLVESLSDATGAEKLKYAAVLAGTRGMSGLVAITNTTNKEYTELKNKIDDATGATKEIADIMMDTTEGSMTRMQHQIENVGIEFGNTMIPYAEKAIEKIRNLTTWIGNLDDKQRDTVVRIGAIVAAAGPVITVLGSITSGIGDIFTGIGDFAAFTIENPAVVAIGAIVVAIGAAVAGYENWKAQIKKTAEEMYGLSDEQENLIKQVETLNGKYASQKEAREATLGGIDAEYAYTKNLLEELQLLTDENGHVTEANKNRVEFILGQLSEATGIEYNMVGDLIKNYQGLVTEIGNVIEEKRIQAQMQVAEQQYDEAIKNQTKAYENYVEVSSELADEKENLAKLQDDLNAKEEEYKKIRVRGQSVKGMQLLGEITQLKADVEAATETVETLSASEQEAYEQYLIYTNTISEYSEVMAAVAKGSTEDIQDALSRMTRGFVTSDTATRQMLVEQRNNFKATYEQMKKDVEAGMPGVTQAQVDEMKKLVDAATLELSKLPANGSEQGQKAGKNLGQGVVDGMESMKADIEATAASAAKAAANGMGAYDKGKTQGHNFGDGFRKGIQEKSGTISIAASGAGLRATQQLSYTMDAHSPSRVTEKLGEYFGQGFALGITNSSDMGADAASKMADNSIAALQASAPVLQVPFGMYGAGNGAAANSTSYTYGDINVTVQGTSNQSAESLAEIIADKINREVYQRRAAYA